MSVRVAGAEVLRSPGKAPGVSLLDYGRLTAKPQVSDEGVQCRDALPGLPEYLQPRRHAPAARDGAGRKLLIGSALERNGIEFARFGVAGSKLQSVRPAAGTPALQRGRQHRF